MAADRPAAAHAVCRLRDARLARSAKPFLARGGSQREHCANCRLVISHCLCGVRRSMPTRSGFCLLMGDIEALKPSNTGWLVADVVPDTFAFGWSRTEVDPALITLLSDPQWQPIVVFPAEYAASDRVVTAVPEPPATGPRPLFILLDATWSEARKMFRKSPSLEALPVLSLHPPQPSHYSLRRSTRDDHFCTSEVAAQCLSLAGDGQAGALLDAYLDVFIHHYLQARQQRPVAWDGEAHRRLDEVSRY